MYSPLRSIPGGDTDLMVKIDLMHCFNIGFGGDLASSTIIGLCHMKVFEDQGHTISKRLDEAFARFQDWCGRTRVTASVKSFELSKFKMTSPLELLFCICFSNLSMFITSGPTDIFLEPLLARAPPRLKDFPEGSGRAHDTALLCKWLGSELEALGFGDVVLWFVDLVGTFLLLYHLFLFAVSFWGVNCPRNRKTMRS